MLDTLQTTNIARIGALQDCDISIFQKRPYINPVIIGQSTSPFISHPPSTYHQKRKTNLSFFIFRSLLYNFDEYFTGRTK